MAADIAAAPFTTQIELRSNSTVIRNVEKLDPDLTPADHVIKQIDHLVPPHWSLSTPRMG